MKTKLKTGIAQRMVEARGQRSQQDIATAAGVSQSTIGNIEAGERKRPRELLRIAAALGVSPVWLETGEGDPQDAGPPPEWPFELLSREQWLALTERQRGAVENAALDVYKGLMAGAAKAPHSGPNSRWRRGTS
jgi:transcriptional regulator with XRE-family HTH domain